MRVGTWNVEGLTDAKLVTLRTYMQSLNIDILCIQETHTPKSNVYTTEDNYLIVLSGVATDEDIETAGVGFIISPQIRQGIIGFTQFSSRISWVKIRVPGGKVPIFSVYAPHNGKPFGTRSSFYATLQERVASVSGNGPKYVVGDSKARLHIK